MKIGDRIKSARIAKRMTQEELGRAVGVQKAAIGKYESGRVVNIKRSTLKKLSDVLCIPPEELIFEDKKNNPTSEGGGLSENRLKLIRFAETVPEDKVELLLRVMRSILEGD